MKNLMLILMDEGRPEYKIVRLPEDHPLLLTNEELGVDETPELWLIFEELMENKDTEFLALPAHVDAITVAFYY